MSEFRTQPLDDTSRKLSDLIHPAYIRAAETVENYLMMIGLSKEELSRRSYCVIRDNVRTYYFDGIPIVKSEITFSDGVISYKVTKLT